MSPQEQLLETQILTLVESIRELRSEGLTSHLSPAWIETSDRNGAISHPSKEQEKIKQLSHYQAILFF